MVTEARILPMQFEIEQVQAVFGEITRLQAGGGGIVESFPGLIINGRAGWDIQKIEEALALSSDPRFTKDPQVRAERMLRINILSMLGFPLTFNSPIGFLRRPEMYREHSENGVMTREAQAPFMRDVYLFDARMISGKDQPYRQGLYVSKTPHQLPRLLNPKAA